MQLLKLLEPDSFGFAQFSHYLEAVFLRIDLHDPYVWCLFFFLVYEGAGFVSATSFFGMFAQSGMEMGATFLQRPLPLLPDLQYLKHRLG